MYLCENFDRNAMNNAWTKHSSCRNMKCWTILVNEFYWKVLPLLINTILIVWYLFPFKQFTWQDD